MHQGNWNPGRTSPIVLAAVCLVIAGGPVALADSLDSAQKPIPDSTDQGNADFRSRRLMISGLYMFASLDSYLRFETADGLLGVRVGLEDHLGLDAQQSLFYGSLIYRFTEHSGLFASYYSLDRSATTLLNEDLPYLGELFEEGSEVVAHFDTRVSSLGYIYSVLPHPDAFLGAFANFYLIQLDAGLESEALEVDKQANYFAPVPCLGLAMSFRLSRRIGVSAEIGAFSLHLDNFTGKLFNMNLAGSYQLAEWIALRAGYTVFDINVEFPEDEFDVTAVYHFRGPAVGMDLRF